MKSQTRCLALIINSVTKRVRGLAHFILIFQMCHALNILNHTKTIHTIIDDDIKRNCFSFFDCAQTKELSLHNYRFAT